MNGTSVAWPMVIPESLEQAWGKAREQLGKGAPDDALETLRGAIGEHGDRAETYVLAAQCYLELGEKATTPKAVLKQQRKARSLLRKGLDLDGRHGEGRALLDELEAKLPSARALSFMPAVYKDGTPTPFGILIAFPVTIMLLVAAIAGAGVLLEGESNNPVVELSVSWTDASGAARSGTITIELFPDDAPKHVENFEMLVRGGDYDGVAFHRVIDGFMVQGGDFTNGDGTGGHAAKYYGYCDGQPSTACENDPDQWTVPDEADNGLTHRPGALSMAKTSAANTGGSQFFLVDRDSNPSHLDGVHTVFGQVTSGMDHVDSISQVPTSSGDVPNNPVTIISARMR